MVSRVDLAAVADEVIAEGIEFGAYRIVRAAISAAEVLVLFYTWGSPDRLIGRIYRDSELAEIYSDAAAPAADIAGSIAALDLGPPPGSGVTRRYPWQEALGLAGVDVEWVNELPSAELTPTLHYADPSWVLETRSPSRGVPAPRAPRSRGSDTAASSEADTEYRYSASFTPLEFGDETDARNG
ncbi:hypothetical protein [Leucobacter luti]|uniref:Uncharacterized protein n=1 Tax=Leucobacter luti TaxID=340320 RepID=A0A4V6MCI0_9MICO|nr:hypothetical protein [Leucobacter luti]MBL3698276.1 hypothetical protein [Leucobacter luti]RZT64639.1 hypothetical protein EV139_2060 [Leucobacter luti]